MATVREYYLRDFNHACLDNNWTVNLPDNDPLDITVRRYLDFDSNAIFIAYYIPECNNYLQVFKELIDKIHFALDISNETTVKRITPGEKQPSSDDLLFCGRIFFYYDGVADEFEFEKIQKTIRPNNFAIRYRDQYYAKEKSRLEVPLAFISHDSRDKGIAKVIAEKLSQRSIPVWYDEFTLNVGDSLRESIDKGLLECKKCILVLTPNFLANRGWTKAEFNAIFNREMLEQKNLILPIWSGIDAHDLSRYSPLLVDKFALRWESLEEDRIITKLRQVILA